MPKDEWLADENHGIAFRECRYISSHVQEHDKLDLMLKDIEVHGRKITVKVNQGRKVDAKELDGKSNVWKKGVRSKRNIARAAMSD